MFKWCFMHTCSICVVINCNISYQSHQLPDANLYIARIIRQIVLLPAVVSRLESGHNLRQTSY